MSDSEKEAKLGEWVEQSPKPKSRDFPSDDVSNELLRINFQRDAHADIMAHAKEDLDRELCGVLLGTVCEDSSGRWISVEATLPGETEAHGTTHVTYTHETWEKIHNEKQSRYPDLLIVGWYHTHPGFGVEFSAMDRFIQENFFSASHQFAIVVDPLSGHEAVLINHDDDLRYLNGVWIGGRKQSLRSADGGSGSSEGTSLNTQQLEKRLEMVEDRLAQVLQSAQQQRDQHHRWFLFFGSLMCLAVFLGIGRYVYQSAIDRATPPERMNFVPVPIEVNGKPALIGIRLESWQIPDSENLIRQQAVEILKTQSNQPVSEKAD